MARVLYGIHGTGHGHAMRGLTIARRLSRHEFLFVADDDAPKILEPEFPVRRLPNLGTVFKNYKVDMAATIGRALPLLWHISTSACATRLPACTGTTNTRPVYLSASLHRTDVQVREY